MQASLDTYAPDTEFELALARSMEDATGASSSSNVWGTAPAPTMSGGSRSQATKGPPSPSKTGKGKKRDYKPLSLVGSSSKPGPRFVADAPDAVGSKTTYETACAIISRSPPGLCTNPTRTDPRVLYAEQQQREAEEEQRRQKADEERLRLLNLPEIVMVPGGNYEEMQDDHEHDTSPWWLLGHGDMVPKFAFGEGVSPQPDIVHEATAAFAGATLRDAPPAFAGARPLLATSPLLNPPLSLPPGLESCVGATIADLPTFAGFDLVDLDIKPGMAPLLRGTGGMESAQTTLTEEAIDHEGFYQTGY